MSLNRSRVVEALVKRYDQIHPARERAPGYRNHLLNSTDNLLIPLRQTSVLEDLKEGDGQELAWKDQKPPKYHSIASSSALSINSFGPFREGDLPLHLAGESHLLDCRFESKPCPPGSWKSWTGISKTNKTPNFDLVATDSSVCVAVESKLCEWFSLGSKDRLLSDQYQATLLQDSVWDAGWRDLTMKVLDQQNGLRHVGLPQLIKHYLALRWYQHNSDGKPTILLYLFWEPKNASDHPECARHREELEQISEMVNGSSVKFVWQSYPELWNEWAAIAGDDSLLEAHVRLLQERYLLDVPI